MCRVSFRNFSLYVIGIDRGRLERKREKAIASYGDSVLRRELCHDSDVLFISSTLTLFSSRVVFRLENPSCASSTTVIPLSLFFLLLFLLKENRKVN